MPNPKNVIWRFFASVKLALVILIVLAVASIIGTLIEQGRDQAHYIQAYGQGLAQLMEALDLTDMYRSWWYIALLSLFAANLVVCTIERLPGVWRTVTLDNLAIDPEQLTSKSSMWIPGGAMWM